MRDVVVGLVLAALLIGGLFAADKMAPDQRPVSPTVQSAQAADKAAAEIHPGYVGTKNIGVWQLACTDKPSTVSVPVKDPSKPADANAPPKTVQVQLGRCRTTLFYRRKDNPRMVMMAVTFRFIGAKHTFGVFVAMPPIVKQGDYIAMQIKKGFLKIPVAGCQPKGLCVARGALQPQAVTQLLTAPAARLIVPQPNGKMAALPLPTVGLSQAVSAMSRAES
ncbi:MAG: invasion associated locus B family protein [Rhizomicrobium sp.]|jgi:invasion protein IalB